MQLQASTDKKSVQTIISPDHAKYNVPEIWILGPVCPADYRGKKVKWTEIMGQQAFK